MNYLAHLVLAGDEEDLRLGAMLGDCIRGREAPSRLEARQWDGILLHRHIDAFTDSLPAVVSLRQMLEPPFRRFGGIIIDLAFDHQLARRWHEFSTVPIDRFDIEVRRMLARHDELLTDGLRRFMAYADRRGLFAAYREPQEILHSLRGVGRRLSRPNPLHRVNEIWDAFEPQSATCFEKAFPEVQSEVADWLKSKSTTTGS